MKKGIFLFFSFFLLFLFTPHYFEMETVLENSSMSDIALTINGTKTDTFPRKDSNLKVSNITCNEGIGYWDYESWGLRIQDIRNGRIKCNIDFTNLYSETILNGADPVLKDNLIPVTIEADGTVKKANLGTKWYSYNENVWANSVILSDKSKTYYDGSVIPESNIESYFVWVPRYKYKIWNTGNYTSVLQTSYVEGNREIEIVFENKNTVVSKGSTVGTYLTHPAFTAFHSNGMWVGKYSTGYKNASSKGTAIVDNVDTSNIVIRPNEYIWNGIRLANMHLNAYNYKRNLESHMMKNTEWGAVTYLSQSKFGIRDNVTWNNNTNFVSGYVSSIMQTCTQSTQADCNRLEAVLPKNNGAYSFPYNYSSSIKGTTSGNISGIYDMAGGAVTSVMALSKMSDSNFVAGYSKDYFNGFKGMFIVDASITTDGINFPDAKYYDVYKEVKSGVNYSNRILGDATGELGPFYKNKNGYGMSTWYQQAAYVISDTSYYYVRGGAAGSGSWNGSDMGIFNFCTDWSSGSARTFTYRIVLSF